MSDISWVICASFYFTVEVIMRISCFEETLPKKKKNYRWKFKFKIGKKLIKWWLKNGWQSLKAIRSPYFSRICRYKQNYQFRVLLLEWQPKNYTATKNFFENLQLFKGLFDWNIVMYEHFRSQIPSTHHVFID